METLPDISAIFPLVMPGLVPGIPRSSREEQDVDGRDEPGHDE